MTWEEQFKKSIEGVLAGYKTLDQSREDIAARVNELEFVLMEFEYYRNQKESV